MAVLPDRVPGPERPLWGRKADTMEESGRRIDNDSGAAPLL